MTVADARRYALQAFANASMLKAQTGSFRLDADLLLQHILHKPRAWLIVHDDIRITEQERLLFTAAVEKRRTGLPIAYITGEKEFWGLPFAVTEAVLIPKPDTELLVERSLEILRGKAAENGSPLTVLDPCTGSGCVAVSILHSLACDSGIAADCIALDISPQALVIAEKNADTLLPPDIRKKLLFYCEDMRNIRLVSQSQPDTARLFDIIAANPPYIPSSAVSELLADGRNEPSLALDGWHNGLDFITLLLTQAPAVLKHGGVFLCEAGEGHISEAAGLFEQAGFSHVRIHKDMAGDNRLIEGVWI